MPRKPKQGNSHNKPKPKQQSQPKGLSGLTENFKESVNTKIQLPETMKEEEKKEAKVCKTSMMNLERINKELEEEKQHLESVKEELSKMKDSNVFLELFAKTKRTAKTTKSFIVMFWKPGYNEEGEMKHKPYIQSIMGNEYEGQKVAFGRLGLKHWVLYKPVQKA